MESLGRTNLDALRVVLPVSNPTFAGNGATESAESLLIHDLPERFQTIIAEGAPHGDRSTQFDFVVKSLLERNANPNSISNLLAQYPNGIAAKYLGRLNQEVDRIYHKFQARPTAAEEFGAKPILDVDLESLHHLATKAEEALVNAGAPIYSRGSTLVRPVVEEVEASRGRRTKVARLSPFTADSLVDHLSRAVRFQKYNARKNKKVDTHPPRVVATTILSRDGEWRFPSLAGVITTPTLRPDCSLLSKVGYDPATRLLLADSPAMPTMATHPTREDAEHALQLMNDLLSEFPFTSEACRSVALSTLISPVVRGAMPVVPLHAMRAPSAGSGKSYLIDLASAIATGQACPVVSAGKTEEETEKRLGAALLTGQPIISIDNLNGDLGGDALCQFVERPFVEIRPLGRSVLTRIESKATIYATGNNLGFVDDMVRRVVICSLDTNSENPEKRQFTSDPLKLVLDDRGKYVAAALTIVRAYAEAGFPNSLPALGSFGEWSRLVRSSLVWLGCADPVETMETARAEDPETAQIRDIVSRWKETLGLDTAFTAGELLHNAAGTSLADSFKDLTNGREPMDARKLGNWLRRRKGRIAHGLKIVGEYSSHAKQMHWILRAIQPAGTAGPGGCDSSPSINNNNAFLKIGVVEHPQIPAIPANKGQFVGLSVAVDEPETDASEVEHDIFS